MHLCWFKVCHVPCSSWLHHIWRWFVAYKWHFRSL